MFARMSRFLVKPDKIEELLEFRRSRLKELKSIAGLNYVFDMMSEDGEYVVLAIYRDKESGESESVMKIVGEFWFRLADLVRHQDIDVKKFSVTYHNDMTSV